MTFMAKKRIIANVIIKNNQVVQSFGYHNYLPIGKPEIILKNLDRWKADEILVNVIDRSKSNLGPNYEILKKISKLSIQTPIIYGGGIASLKDAIEVTKLGADRILVESVVEENFSELEKIFCTIGSQSVVISLPLAIDKKKGIVFFDYKKKKEKKISKFFLDAFEKKLFSEILIIDYKNQGLSSEFNINILNEFKNNCPLIIYGGINKKANIQDILKDKRVSALAFGNSLNYKEHSIQKIKSLSKRKIFRSAYYDQG